MVSPEIKIISFFIHKDSSVECPIYFSFNKKPIRYVFSHFNLDEKISTFDF